MPDSSPWSKLGLYINLIYAFPLTVLVGVGLGYLVDREAGTSPWFTFLGFLLGLGGGFSLLFRTVKILEKKKRGRGDGEP